MDEIVQHIECTSAKEFLDLLSPRGELFGAHLRRDNEWVYRGHGDDAFKLIPKSLREHERQNLFKLAGSPLPEGQDNLSQLNAEIGVVEHFIHDCNQSGLVVPGYGAHLDLTLRTSTRWLKAGFEVPQNWPHPPMIPALCLAQHHGVPTRLLDWSYSSYKAAHFAASGCSQSRDSMLSPNFSVWALRLSALGCMPPLSAAIDQNRVDIITPSRCDNAYLHAQEGLFTLCRVHAFDNSQTLDRRPLNEQMKQFENPKPYGFKSFPIFYHLTLKSTEAVDCLRGLEQLSITAATLFPDYGGVVQAMFHSIMLRKN